jgi:predicted RND superfamily exporter protein
MWVKIARIILRNRIAFLISIALITVFMAYQATKVEMSYEYAALLPKSDTASIESEKFKSIFGQENSMIIIGVQDKDFYQLDKFNDWLALGDSLKNIKGIDAHMSLGSAYTLKKNKKEKKFDIIRLFPNKLESQKQLDSLAKKAESLPIYYGTLLNKDAHTYSLFVTVNAKTMASKKRVKVVQEIKDRADAFAQKHNLKLHYSGMPYIRVQSAEMIKSEMMMFILLSLFITALILFLFFRSFKIVGFCMLIIGISVIWAVGSMAILGFKITLLTAMLPPLLIVIGIPNSVFMVNKFHGEFAIHRNKIKALQRMIRKIGNATLLTNLTTASGFATFIITSSTILVEFGLVAALNIMLVFILSLILIPCIFSLIAPPSPKQISHLKNRMVKGFVDKLVSLVLSKRTYLYITAFLIIVFSAIGMTRMKSTGYMVDDLPHDNPLVQDLKFFEKNFDGILPLEVMVDVKKKGKVLSLSTLRRLDKLDKSISKSPNISNSLSVVTGLKYLNQTYYNGKEKYFKLPTSTTKNFVMSYLLHTNLDGGNNKNMAAFNSFVDKNKQYARLSFRVKDIGTDKMALMEKDVISKINKIFPSSKYNITCTGSSILFYRGTKYLVKNLASSLILAVFIIALFMAWMFNSKRMVVVALIPNIIPLLFTAALMGYLGVPIKASTILVFSIAFGISVDDTIHFLAKYRQELQVTGWNIKKSVVFALKETGQSMMYTSIILFFGFGIFSLSNFGGTVSLGVLVSITLLAAMFSNLVILPSLLMSLDKMITNKAFKEPLLQIYNEEEDIDLEELKIDTSKYIIDIENEESVYIPKDKRIE